MIPAGIGREVGGFDESRALLKSWPTDVAIPPSNLRASDTPMNQIDNPKLVDRSVIQCNYAESTSAIAKGARAYVIGLNSGGGHDRLRVLARSRGGRWIKKWEDRRRLINFRVKTLSPEHPLYGNNQVQSVESDQIEEFLAAVSAGGIL